MSMRFGNMNKDNKYYAVFAEWLYPTESGRDFIGDYDTLEDALAACEEACDREFENYMEACGCDALWPCQYSDGPREAPKGWTITAANGLDEWWYAAKIVPITYGE